MEALGEEVRRRYIYGNNRNEGPNQPVFHRKIRPPGDFKKIIIFFDERQAYDTSENDAQEFSNIFYKCGALSTLRKLQYLLDQARSQITYYQKWEQSNGLKDLVRRAYEFLLKNHKPGDEISFFGFGKGCHAVSTLCELLEYRALPSNNSPWNSDEIWDELSDFQKAVESDIDPVLNTFGASRSIGTRQPGPVHFVGLFDAVAFEPELGESSNSRIS